MIENDARKEMFVNAIDWRFLAHSVEYKPCQNSNWHPNQELENQHINTSTQAPQSRVGKSTLSFITRTGTPNKTWKINT